MSQQQENGDPDTEKIKAYTGGGSIDREEMVAGYLPETDDWPAKTFLEKHDPALLAALSQMGTMYPEVEDLQPLIDEAMEMFMKSQTSVAGSSREEYKAIFQSMFGGSADDDSAGDRLAAALAGDLDED